MENQIQLKQEGSSSVVLRQQGKIYSLNELGGDLKNFGETDLRIINARKTGVSLCDQTKEQFEFSLTGIIFNISVICGCQLPSNDVHANALEKEFAKFITDYGYEGLTTEEVLTAFRMNANFLLGEKVETYGKIFNVDFAAQVLRLYREKRGRVDAVAESIFQKREYDSKLEEDSTRRRKKVVEQFEKYLADENAELDLSNCFMQLREDGAFSNKKVADDGSNYFRGSTELARLLNSFEGLDTRFQQEQGAVKYLFKNMKLTGRLKVYDENLVLLHPGFELPERFEKKEINPEDKPF